MSACNRMDACNREHLIIEQLKRLWETSFGDTREYTDFYFSRLYNQDKIVTKSVDGEIVSAAQYRHFDIAHKGAVLKGVYIVGVCTRPEHRRKGLSAELVQQILAEQSKADVDLAFLIPQSERLFQYYERFGFRAVFTAYEERVSLDGISADETYELVDPSSDKVYNFYINFHRALETAVIKDRDFFMFVLDDYARYGQIRACAKGGEIRGFAAAEGDVIKEILYTDIRARDTLLKSLSDSGGAGELKVISPVFDLAKTQGAVKKTIGMARVLNPSSFLSKTARKPTSVIVYDNLFPKNTDTYNIHIENVLADDPIKLDISELAPVFMKDAYANLLLN